MQGRGGGRARHGGWGAGYPAVGDIVRREERLASVFPCPSQRTDFACKIKPFLFRFAEAFKQRGIELSGKRVNFTLKTMGNQPGTVEMQCL